MRRLGLVLLSGGLDSTTVAALAVRQGYQLSAVTVHYGQAHRREIESANAVAAALGIRHQVVDVTFFKELAWYSALTHPEQFALPANRSTHDMTQDIPIVRLAMAVGAPLAHTWSCYAGGERPCGGCDSCLLRAKGFEEAGAADPALAA
jgi:7-cyano-7-deazaguanine synthase in queuosine biosynthesis